MASLSHLGQNPNNRDGFYTLLLHLCYFCLIMDCQIRSLCLYSLISLYCTIAASLFLFSPSNSQQQSSNRWMVKEIYSCRGHAWPLCLGYVPPSLHRDSFCVQQPPLLAQISLDLTRLINYSPGIKETSPDLLTGYFQPWTQNSNKWMDSHPIPPKRADLAVPKSLLQLSLKSNFDFCDIT